MNALARVNADEALYARLVDDSRLLTLEDTIEFCNLVLELRLAARELEELLSF